jgi:hypothetical protein
MPNASLEQQIRDLLAVETRATSLSDKLFSPTGLFSRLAQSQEERRVLVQSPLFKEAQKRFRELQYQEAEAFSHATDQASAAGLPPGWLMKLEKADMK